MFCGALCAMGVRNGENISFRSGCLLIGNSAAKEGSEGDA